MQVRVVKDFIFDDSLNKREFQCRKGQLISVPRRSDYNRLLAEGFITRYEYSYSDPYGIRLGTAADQYEKTKRIGIWLVTSRHYSGGRIHMFQYAHALARAGNEVFLITNREPRWEKDYPNQVNLFIVLSGQNPIPPDLDVIVTDSKDEFGRQALDYKQTHPHIPLVCMNFETPNWVANYDEEYARKLNVPKEVFLSADMLMANSQLSKKYLLEWLDRDIPCHVVPPMVNTYAVEDVMNGYRTQNRFSKNRPYAVYSARSAEYKGGHVAVDAIWELDTPMDLVIFGRLQKYPPDSKIHSIVPITVFTDREKFYAMKNAEFVLAPSKFEGYGMVPAEAMSVGTPCIVYDLPVLREEYGEPEGLIYVPWGDESAYKKQVADLVANPELKPEPNTTATKLRHGMDAMGEITEKLPYHHFEKPVVTAHMVAYWGFVPEALEAIYDHVDQILVAFGRVPHARSVDDGSLSRLMDFPDPDKKIIVENRTLWQAGKKEMRNWACSKATGNYMLLLDGDEIWVGLDEWLTKAPAYGSPRWLNLWHGLDHWIYDTVKQGGNRWGKRLQPFGSTCPHYRWSWWRGSYYFLRHPWPVDQAQETIVKKGEEEALLVPECCIYHLGHALSREVMEAKHDFYLERDGFDQSRIQRKNAWHEWKGQLGEITDGIVAEVDWEMPDIVKRAYASSQEILV